MSNIKEAAGRKKIVYAGGSQRRLWALQQIRHIDVSSFEGGPEDDIDNVLKIALGKIEYVFPRVMSEIAHEEEGQYSETMIVAADARTEIHRPKGRGRKSIFDSKGKPKTPDQVMDHFQQMSNQAERDGRGMYRVVASSAVQKIISRTPEKVQSLAQTQSAEVYLDKDELKWLTTDEGFAAYQEAFKQFYGSEIYTGEGFTPPRITDLSGGLSLPVLLRMGIVEQVGDQRITRKQMDGLFRSVRKALLVVAVGFGPKVLREIDRSAYDQLLKWQWLNEATKAALDMD